MYAAVGASMWPMIHSRTSSESRALRGAPRPDGGQMFRLRLWEAAQGDVLGVLA
jgi:hypothetical protein